MDIGETKVLDIRLPLAANRLGTTPEGYRVPFTYLHALVDSHQQIPETFEDNNGAVLLRKDILPVDPAAAQVLAQPCPCCGGRMFVIETFEAGCQPRHRPTAPLVAIRIDTS